MKPGHEKDIYIFPHVIFSIRKLEAGAIGSSVILQFLL